MGALAEIDAPSLDAALLRSDEPFVVRRLVADWPAVRAASAPAGITAYLRRLDVGTVVGAWLGGPEIEGRFDYRADFAGFNFAREKLPFTAALTLIERHRDDPRPPAVYVGSTTVDTCVPGFRAENDLRRDLFGPHEPLASLWLGNRTCVAPHQDLPDNLACVAAGRRRFTLFPPAQVGNLYVGPIENTLAGQPTSLVDLRRPDLQRFPRFAEALAHARVAELEPGDAIFVPSLWWHGVEALEPVNLLVNYWWRRSPEYMDSPMGALLHAILSVRDLPAAQRDAWRRLFDHYVFDFDPSSVEHIPPRAREILAPLDENAVRGLRARMLRRLNR